MNVQSSVLEKKTEDYSILQFLSCRRKKEREYESWVDRVSWTRTTRHEEKERADTDFGFSAGFSVGVRACFFTGFASGVRPLFGPHTKMEAVIFICLDIFAAGAQLASVPLRVQLLTHFQSRVVTYFHLVLERGLYPFPVVPHLHRRFGILGYFPVIFNYRSISPVTGWSTTSTLA